MSITLDPALDFTGAAETLTRTGRARIENVLAPDAAQALHAAMSGSDIVWRRSLDNPANVDITVAHFEAQPPEEQARLVAMVHEGARDGFQFLFDRFRIGHAARTGEPAPGALFALYDLFNSEAWLDFARNLTGDGRINHVDAQATRYLPGHFLNGHNDHHPEAGRLYAYVLNLCPGWRAEWGGLLLFKDEDGGVEDAFTPGFNTLNVFRVPQAHAVSLVAPFAGGPRLSITGWWRTHA